MKMIILSTLGNMVPTSTANNDAARLSKGKTKIIPPYLWKKKKNEHLQDHLRNLSVLKVDHLAFKRAQKPTRLECKKNPLLCLVIFDVG